MTGPLEQPVRAEFLPEDAESFLRDRGWSLRSGRSDVAQLWSQDRDDRLLELLVPQRPAAADYERRWRDLLHNLAAIEGRSVEAISDDILASSSDVAEWRAVQVADGEYTLPLDDAHVIISGVREAVIAAASSSLHRRSFFGHRKTKQAREHARLVRMGQTRRGSYVIPIISRLPALEEDAGDTSGADQDRLLEATVVPFQRQVMATLARGMATVHQLAVEGARAPTQRQLNEAVGSGVSAELCGAIERALSAETVRKLDINFRWSRRIPTPSGATAALSFPSSAGPRLGEMRELLRQADAPARQEIFGTVINLHRDDQDIEGTVTVKMVLGSQRRQVRMRLGPSQHDTATECYSSRRPIRAVGVLNNPPGAGWWLEEVDDFGVAQPYLGEQEGLEPASF
jgi:hypothetical protein